VPWLRLDGSVTIDTTAGCASWATWVVASCSLIVTLLPRLTFWGLVRDWARSTATVTPAATAPPTSAAASTVATSAPGVTVRRPRAGRGDSGPAGSITGHSLSGCAEAASMPAAALRRAARGAGLPQPGTRRVS